MVIGSKENGSHFSQVPDFSRNDGDGTVRAYDQCAAVGIGANGVEFLGRLSPWADAHWVMRRTKVEDEILAALGETPELETAANPDS